MNAAMQTLGLTQDITGGFAFTIMPEILLSPEDQDLLDYSWHLSSSGYALVNSDRIKLRPWKYSPEYIHHIVLQRVYLVLPPKTIGVCDHINGNRLDNRRENLRLISQSENIVRKFKVCKNKLGYWAIGKYSDKYEVLFKINCATNHFGCYETKEEAAWWSDVYRCRIQGKEIQYNFPERLDEIIQAAVALDLPAYPIHKSLHANLP